MAEDDKGPCGLLTLARAPTTLGLGTFALLDDFHVRADRRGRGIGTRLLAAARDHAARLGVAEIRLTADRGARLARLYESAGFRRSDLGLFTLSLPLVEDER